MSAININKNTILEDIIPICTVGASHDSGDVGFKVGNAAFGGAQIVGAVVNAIQNDSTSTAAGQGAWRHRSPGAPRSRRSRRPSRSRCGRP